MGGGAGVIFNAEKAKKRRRRGCGAGTPIIGMASLTLRLELRAARETTEEVSDTSGAVAEGFQLIGVYPRHLRGWIL